MSIWRPLIEQMSKPFHTWVSVCRISVFQRQQAVGSLSVNFFRVLTSTCAGAFGCTTGTTKDRNKMLGIAITLRASLILFSNKLGTIERVERIDITLGWIFARIQKKVQISSNGYCLLWWYYHVIAKLSPSEKTNSLNFCVFVLSNTFF